MLFRSEAYDRELDDIFAVQDDIAQSVVTKLRATLMAEKVAAAENVVAEVAGASKGRSENVEAQRLYMQGRHLLNRKSAEDLMRSITYFQEAVALDPGFGLAWASLAQAHHDTGGWGLEPVQEANERALAAMEKALALAPDLVEVHLSHAAIQLGFQFNWVGAQASLKCALQLDPDNADALAAASRLQFCLGDLDESVMIGRRAVARDPLNAASHRGLAISLFEAGDIEGAVQLMRLSLELSPDSIASRHVLALILGMQGRHEAALAEALLEKAEWARLTATSLVRWLMKEHAESNRLLALLEVKHGQHSAVQIASLHAMRGSADLAFAWLERAYAQRDAGLVFIKSIRFFEPVRDDPRWALFLKKMGFPV